MPPQTRARFAQSTQEEVLALPPAKAAAIRMRTGAAWQRISSAPPVSWLDEETYNALTESIRAELGDKEMQRMYRRLGRRILSNPNLQAFVESVIRMLGMSPHSLLKAAPRGRASIVQNSGILIYEWSSDRSAKLHLRDFPASTFRTGTTVVLLSGTWLGLLDAADCGSEAAVTMQNVDLQAGMATFVLTW